MIKGKPLILLIRGRQNISKWSNNSYREAICCRKPPQFVVTSRDGTVTSSHCWSDQTRRPSLTPWWSQAHPKSQIQSLTQKYLQGIPQACHPPLSLPWWSPSHLRPQTQLLFLIYLPVNHQTCHPAPSSPRWSQSLLMTQTQTLI